MPAPIGDRPEPSRAGGAPLVAAMTVLAALAVRGAAAPASEAMRPELWLTDRSLGWASTGFGAALLAAAAWLDLRPARRARPDLAALALAAAGALALATTAARGPWTLLLARVASGAAAGVAVGAALGRVREAGARLAAWLAAAMIAGLLVADLAGGAVARGGWRGPFVAAAAIALAAAVLAFRRRPRARDAAPPLLADLAATGVRPALRRLAGDRGRACAIAGAAAWTLGISALAAWLPAFLERVRQVPRGAATLGVGGAAAALAFAGALAGAGAVRALSARTRDGGAIVAAITAGGAALTATGALFAWRPALYLPALLGTLLLAAAAAPALWRAAGDRLRAADDPALVAVSALLVLAVDAAAPLVAGAVAHRLGLWKGLLLVPLALGAAGALLAAAAGLRPADRAPRDADQDRPSASA